MAKIDRVKLRAMFGGRCAYCGHLLGNHFHADHIDPKYRGGKDDEANLFPACPRCNLRKSTYTVEEFRNEIKMQAARLMRDSRPFMLALDFGQIKETRQDVSFWFERHPAGLRTGLNDGPLLPRDVIESLNPKTREVSITCLGRKKLL